MHGAQAGAAERGAGVTGESSGNEAHRALQALAAESQARRVLQELLSYVCAEQAGAPPWYPSTGCAPT